MLHILTCHAYFLRFDQKRLERNKPYPPLATLQMAAMLRQAGHEVVLFDAMLATGIEEFQALLDRVEPDVVLLYEDNFNFLSKMCLGRMRAAACEMMELARKAGCRTIAAGSDATDAADVYLRAGADWVLRGEGLSALFELLPRLDAQLDGDSRDLIAGLSGITTRAGGELVTLPGDRVLPARSFDGTPAWDLVDIERYRSIWLNAHGFFSMNMAASRGCSFRCAWCAKPIWGNRYLQRNASAVAAEMTHLRKAYGASHVWFADDIFGFRVDWVTDFARAVHAAGGSVPFSIQTRADLTTEPMAQALAHAGCEEAWIGAESGSQRVLDAMNKGTTVAEIHAARARLKAAGVRVGFFIQLGYIDEDMSDILATRTLLEIARPDDVGVSVSYPLPGTKFHERVKAQLGAKTHWEDSGDLAMMFQGTYTSEFYRAVRNLMHEQVSLEKLNVPEHAHTYQKRRGRLDEQWAELLADEASYRSVPRPAAATQA